MASLTSRKDDNETRSMKIERQIANIQMRRSIIIHRPGANFGVRAANKQMNKWQSLWHMSTYLDLSSDGLGAARDSGEREKKEMQDLNERLASYIESVRFQKAQNLKLAEELRKWKIKWEEKTSQFKYDGLDDARTELEVVTIQKSHLEVDLISEKEELEELRRR